MSDWISVKDAMPPEKKGKWHMTSDMVFVVIQEGATRDVDRSFTVDGKWTDENVTHWMPMPEYPPFDEELYEKWLTQQAAEGRDDNVFYEVIGGIYV